LFGKALQTPEEAPKKTRLRLDSNPIETPTKPIADGSDKREMEEMHKEGWLVHTFCAVIHRLCTAVEGLLRAIGRLSRALIDLYEYQGMWKK
jgi:hypothetical protein